MADYLYVPKTANNKNEYYYVNGITLFTSNNNAYKVAYYGEEVAIRIGVWQETQGSNNTAHYVVVSSEPIASISLRAISPYMSSVGRIDSIVNVMPGSLNGYYNTFSYTTSNVSFKTTVFSSLNETLAALAFSVEPGPLSGVVVTVTATPEYVPEPEGVVVTVVARLADPNEQGGTSEQGGGQGTFDDTSDPVPVPPLPTLDIAQSGLIALFRPTLADLKQLGAYLWTNLSDFIENLNKLFANPMDYIIALNIVPCVPDVDSPVPINIGSVTTTIELPPIRTQWYEHNCGTIIIPEYWGSALDYAPNTKISLFLPFIGSVTLNTDEVMNKQIGIKYRIDLLSGQCVAMVSVDNAVYYQYTGECSVTVPLTGSDWSRVYSAAIGVVGTAITGGIAAGTAGAAAGGATSALAGATAADAASNAGLAYSMINDTSKGVRGVAAMRQQMLEASQMALDAGRQAASAPSRVANGVRATRIANTVNNVVGQVMGAKANVQHSGTISGSAGMLGVRTPYIIIEFPNQSLADNYKHFVGYPANLTGNLSQFSGYTECEQVIVNATSGQTDSELSEVIETLKGGVYL